MGQKIVTLSGAATDVLYALFFRGALQSGDLPSKSGAAQLRELGLAETRHTATRYQKENYFTFLTAEGQEFAVKCLVDTRFGVPGVASSVVVAGKLYSAGNGISIEGDQCKVVFEADRFKVHKAAQSTSNNEERALNGGLAFVGFPGAISHGHDDRSNATKTILTDEMREAIISAVRESDLFTPLQTAIAAQAASTSGLQQTMVDAVNDAIRNSLRPGGAIWNNLGSR
ncbi:hypothetical protein [Enterobacter sp.]|uniref:hypothetical protein n=1 Tax=Enterobacter sp. TaxID=42895 RepID=UPI0039E65F1E